ncbi:hypothetical protein [Lutispora sp.]|uniref:hypothetical protein n=1 Tax=Lutispora sp. TaxID=2828727 RepID=UPI0035643105
MFSPIMSHDGSYLVYHKPRFVDQKYLMTDYDDYGETGIYIYDLNKDENYKIESDIFKDYELYVLYPSRIIRTSIDYNEYVTK